MDKNIRTLKVVKSFSNQRTARLPLSGKWLEKAGFKIGMQVNVIVVKECLLILPEFDDKS